MRVTNIEGFPEPIEPKSEVSLTGSVYLSN